MPKVILQGYITVANADLAAVQRELPAHIENTRQEPGCLVFNVKQDASDPNVFTVYEEFVNQDAFEYHQQRVQHSSWGHVTQNISRHYQVKMED